MENGNNNSITKLTLVRIFLRSFLIQAAWNFEKMQNIGFMYCMMPALKIIYGSDSTQMQLAVKRHLEFFNTHPYLSAPILGATIRLEEEYKESGKGGAENINIFKSSMMGICGGAGDIFFWGAARPVAAIFGVILALTFDGIYAPLGCFILYNIVHLSYRASTFFLGYSQGVSIFGTLKKIDLRSQTAKLKKFEAVLIGLLLALIKNKFSIYNFNTLFYNLIVYFTIILFIAMVYFLLKKNLSPVLIVYIAAIFIVSISYFYKGVIWN